MPPQEAGPAAKAGRRIRPGRPGSGGSGGGDLSREGRIFPPALGRPSVTSETSEDESHGSQRLLHRFTYFLMFINVSQGWEIDWEHPWGRHGAPGGRIARFRARVKKRRSFLDIRPLKKTRAYISIDLGAMKTRECQFKGARILVPQDNRTGSFVILVPRPV